MAQPLAQLLAPGAKARNLDLAALLAIAGHEGAPGGIGDNGHAFGPFQLNDAGGVVTGKLSGTPQQRNAWAWSPAGINYALDGIAKVASGQRGAQAVQSIASKFERPANVQAEISDALAHYGKNGAAMSPTLPGAPALSQSAQPGTPATSSLLGSLISSTNQMVGLGSSPTLASLLAKAPANAAWGTPGKPTVGGKAGLGQSGLPPLPTPGKPSGIAELLREGTGGPTHSTGPHIHAAFTDPKTEIAAIQVARQLGLHIGENPYVGDTVDPVHAPNSFHTRTFPGTYNGRRLGQAIDVSGNPAATNAFYARLSGRR